MVDRRRTPPLVRPEWSKRTVVNAVLLRPDRKRTRLSDAILFPVRKPSKNEQMADALFFFPIFKLSTYGEKTSRSANAASHPFLPPGRSRTPCAFPSVLSFGTHHFQTLLGIGSAPTKIRFGRSLDCDFPLTIVVACIGRIHRFSSTISFETT